MQAPQESAPRAAEAEAEQAPQPMGAETEPLVVGASADQRRWQVEADRLEDLLENERARTKALVKKLEVAESGPDKATKREINFWRQRVESFETEKHDYTRRIFELKQQLAAHREPELARAAAGEMLQTDAFDAGPRVGPELGPSHSSEARGAEHSANIGSVDSGDLRSIESSDAHSTESSSAQDAEAGLVTAFEAAREQIAGLEAELSDEKEFAAGLNQVANERFEALVKLEEKIEESEERLAEVKWQLGKAQHFARLLKRRNGLIENLLATLRAKNKANVALKAGLDGLRTYKAKAEANQSDLLARIDKLSSEIKEREEAAAQWKRKYDFVTTEAPSAYQAETVGRQAPRERAAAKPSTGSGPSERTDARRPAGAEPTADVEGPAGSHGPTASPGPGAPQGPAAPQGTASTLEPHGPVPAETASAPSAPGQTMPRSSTMTLPLLAITARLAAPKVLQPFDATPAASQPAAATGPAAPTDRSSTSGQLSD